jgi:hypothetical protein
MYICYCVGYTHTHSHDGAIASNSIASIAHTCTCTRADVSIPRSMTTAGAHAEVCDVHAHMYQFKKRCGFLQYFAEWSQPALWSMLTVTLFAVPVHEI